MKKKIIKNGEIKTKFTELIDFKYNQQILLDKELLGWIFKLLLISLDTQENKKLSENKSYEEERISVDPRAAG